MRLRHVLLLGFAATAALIHAAPSSLPIAPDIIVAPDGSGDFARATAAMWQVGIGRGSHAQFRGAA